MQKPILLILIILLAGCSGIVPHKSRPVLLSKPGTAVSIDDSKVVQKKLMEQYAEWKGTRYRRGGMSKMGVDCSGFVYITFLLKLGIPLPRSTDLQAACGMPVSKDNLQVGDLVFFKTGFFEKHVGIYIGESKFLHASSKKGVLISKLTHKYWASAYTFSRRIKI